MWVIGEDGQPLPAGTSVDSPQGGQAVHGRMLDPSSESLLDLVHFAAVESSVRRLHILDKPRDARSATPTMPEAVMVSMT